MKLISGESRSSVKVDYLLHLQKLVMFLGRQEVPEEHISISEFIGARVECSVGIFGERFTCRRGIAKLAKNNYFTPNLRARGVLCTNGT